ncbi:DnaJ-domain-containing protein [Cyathus striatus]|nr:DnaJ-domain-containing protein [Cyathus striatus]
MSSAENDANAYELLGINDQATEQEIRTAYRQRSLKVHPDRNPNNPDAGSVVLTAFLARKFHELNQAYELLLDPLRRLALDATLRVKQARAKKYQAYDSKRKAMIDELEEREREFKKRKMNQQKEEAAQFQETERIKEEGRRLREDKEKQARKMEEERLRAMRSPAPVDDEVPPALDPLDTTVRLKYSLNLHPDLTTAESIAKLLKSFGYTDTETIVLSLKSKKKSDKPPKHGTALVPFKQIGDAFAAVCASGRQDQGLHGIEISWVRNNEPQIIGWLKKMGKLGSIPPTSSGSSGKQQNTKNVKAELPQLQTIGDTPFSSFPSTFPDATIPPKESTPVVTPGLDYETLTLMRMRQVEKERLEREILEQEANES